jgi:hypothetical protein
MSSSGKKYYRAHIDVVLSLGLTETKAQVCWMENVGLNLLDVCYCPNIRFFFVGGRKEVRLLCRDLIVPILIEYLQESG